MAVYNSFASLNQDDSDITIINPSIIHGHNDEYVNNTYVPIITRLKQANNSSENRQITNPQAINNVNKCENSNGKHDYIFVDHNPQENAKQLEQVLLCYIRDLKQETQTQLDCDQQLVTRIMDLIRPAYSTDQKKMIELDKIMEEISSLNDKRHVENKEKIELLRAEICQLNKMLCTPKDEQLIYNENNRNYSMPNTIHQGHSINDYDQWTEIEDDAKKLHEIVQSQKNQINEIVTLISQTATAPTSFNPTDVSINNSEDTAADKHASSAPNTHFISTLLKRIQDITGQPTQHEPVTTLATPQGTVLENHSPGTSPSQSLATLTLESLQLTVNNPVQQITEPHDRPIDNKELIHEKPHEPIDIPLTPAPANEPKKCPVCNHEFGLTSDDVEMYDHIENCLFPSGTNTEQKDYECPNCNRKFPGIDESAYLQHLSDCYNRDM